MEKILVWTGHYRFKNHYTHGYMKISWLEAIQSSLRNVLLKRMTYLGTFYGMRQQYILMSSTWPGKLCSTGFVTVAGKEAYTFNNKFRSWNAWDFTTKKVIPDHMWLDDVNIPFKTKRHNRNVGFSREFHNNWRIKYNWNTKLRKNKKKLNRSTHIFHVMN